MLESEKANLFETLQSVVDSIIKEKRKNPKFIKKLNKFNANINLGLQMSADYFFWLNLTADNGEYKLTRDKLTSYDLELKATPEDLLYFLNRENSVVHMITKKNKYGNRKLVIGKGTTGRNLGTLLQLSKILVLEKIKFSKTEDVIEYEKPRIKPASKEITLIKKKYKLLIATIIGICLPGFLTFLFMLTLEQIPLYWQLINGDPGVFFSMVIFNTFNMVSDIPLLGLGYWTVFIVWAVTGLFIGLISRDILRSLIIDVIAIGVNIIIYSIFIFIYYPSFPSIFISNLLKQSYLWDGLVSGLFIPFNIFIQITIDSYAFPMVVLFTLIGGLINPRPEIYALFDEKRVSRVKDKYKDFSIQKKTATLGKINRNAPPRDNSHSSIQNGDNL